MASVFPAPVSAVQVGSYFVQQYYQVLQQQPDFVHQFYTDASNMYRIDGDKIESATAMLQIHALIISLNFTGIEIKTAQSLDSWNGGVLVMVSGSVVKKESAWRRKFVETFFLAPQEKGYFVLNDIFQFVDEDEQLQQSHGALLAQSHYDSASNISNSLPEPVSDYVPVGETQSREFVASPHVEESDAVENYSIPEHQHQQSYGVPEHQQSYGVPEHQQNYGVPEHQQSYSVPEHQQSYSVPEHQQNYGVPEHQHLHEHQVPEINNVVEATHVEELTTSFSHAMNSVQDPSPAPAEESVGEPQKHTYASILRVPKSQATSAVASQRFVNKTEPPTSEWHHAPEATQQFYPVTAMGSERSTAELTEELATHDEEGEGRSVYVKNLSSTISASDIEEEFRNFGALKPDGVVVRNRKDVNVWYAFVEFEDAIGAQNAIKASPVQIGGRQIFIEERRPNPNGAVSRGRGRGRGRSGYPSDTSRGGRYGGRSFGRGNGEGFDRDYNNRPRGNGYYRRGPSQDRGILGNHGTRNGQNSYDDAA